LKSEVKAANHHSVPDLFWQQFGMFSLVRNAIILQCFAAVGWVARGHLTCKNLLPQNPMHENQGKNRLIQRVRKKEKAVKNSVCDCVCVCVCYLLSEV